MKKVHSAEFYDPLELTLRLPPVEPPIQTNEEEIQMKPLPIQTNEEIQMKPLPIQTNEEIQMKPTKRTLPIQTNEEIQKKKEEEDKYYQQKIQEFFQRKIKKNSRQESSSDHQKPVVKRAKYTKKPANKRPRSSVDDDENKKKKKTKKNPVPLPVIISNEITDRLKAFVTEEMKGSELKLVIQKLLYSSDLDPHQNRLSMPVKKLQTLDFLTPNERRMLDENREFEVALFGPTLRMHTKPMVLKKWRMKTTCNYVLITNWKHFVVENRKDLVAETTVQVWSFRRDEKLCFALACLGKVDN